MDTSNWVHVYPVNDLIEHKLEGLVCECCPKLDWNDNLVIHNALDGRE